MTDIIKRIDALVARAASSEIEEARTSAWKACELNREHKIVLTLPAKATSSSPTNNPFRPPPTTDGFVDFVSGMADALLFSKCTVCGLKRLNSDMFDQHVCKICKSHERSQDKKKRKAHTVQHEPKWRRLTVRRAGLCERCGIRINPREEVWHKKGTGIRHLRCHT